MGKEIMPVSNNYSTEEQWTGKYWIDGKPIYRKTFKGTPSLSTGTYRKLYTLTTTINNISDIVKCYGGFDWVQSSTNFKGSFFSGNFLDNSGLSNHFTSYARYAGSTLTAAIDSNIGSSELSVSSIVLTVEYTKTTD